MINGLINFILNIFNLVFGVFINFFRKFFSNIINFNGNKNRNNGMCVFENKKLKDFLKQTDISFLLNNFILFVIYFISSIIIIIVDFITIFTNFDFNKILEKYFKNKLFKTKTMQLNFLKNLINKNSNKKNDINSEVYLDKIKLVENKIYNLETFLSTIAYIKNIEKISEKFNYLFNFSEIIFDFSEKNFNQKWKSYKNFINIKYVHKFTIVFIFIAVLESYLFDYINSLYCIENMNYIYLDVSKLEESYFINFLFLGFFNIFEIFQEILYNIYKLLVLDDSSKVTLDYFKDNVNNKVTYRNIFYRSYLNNSSIVNSVKTTNLFNNEDYNYYFNNELKYNFGYLEIHIKNLIYYYGLAAYDNLGSDLFVSLSPDSKLVISLKKNGYYKLLLQSDFIQNLEVHEKIYQRKNELFKISSNREAVESFVNSVKNDVKNSNRKEKTTEFFCNTGECEFVIKKDKNDDNKIDKSSSSMDVMNCTTCNSSDSHIYDNPYIVMDHVDGSVNFSKSMIDFYGETTKKYLFLQAKKTNTFIKVPLRFENDNHLINMFTSPFYNLFEIFQKQLYPNLLERLDYSYNITPNCGSNGYNHSKSCDNLGNFYYGLHESDKFKLVHKNIISVDTSNDLFNITRGLSKFKEKLEYLNYSGDNMGVDILHLSNEKPRKLARSMVLSYDTEKLYKSYYWSLRDMDDFKCWNTKSFIFVSGLFDRGFFELKYNSAKLLNMTETISLSSVGGSYAMSSSMLHNFLTEYVCKPSEKEYWINPTHRLNISFLVFKKAYTPNIFNTYFHDVDSRHFMAFDYKKASNGDNIDVNDSYMLDTSFFRIYEINLWNNFHKETHAMHLKHRSYFFKSIYEDNIKLERIKALTYVYNCLRGFCNAAVTQIAWVNLINFIIVISIFFVFMCNDFNKKNLNIQILFLKNFNFFKNYFSKFFFKNNFLIKLNLWLIFNFNLSKLKLIFFKKNNVFNTNLNLKNLNFLNCFNKLNLWKPIFKRKSYLGFYFSNKKDNNFN